MTEENLEATLSRRIVLRAFAVGAVGVAFLRRGVLEAALDQGVSLSADVWLSIDTAGRVELVSHKVEMGQGIHEALRRIVAHTMSLPPLSIRPRLNGSVVSVDARDAEKVLRAGGRHARQAHRPLRSDPLDTRR